MSDSLLAGVRADTQSRHLHAQTADRTCRARQPCRAICSDPRSCKVLGCMAALTAHAGPEVTAHGSTLDTWMRSSPGLASARGCTTAAKGMQDCFRST